MWKAIEEKMLHNNYYF